MRTPPSRMLQRALTGIFCRRPGSRRACAAPTGFLASGGKAAAGRRLRSSLPSPTTAPPSSVWPGSAPPSSSTPSTCSTSSTTSSTRKPRPCKRHRSSAASFRRNSYRPRCKMPSSSIQGFMEDLLMMIFLKKSLVFFRGRSSVSILAGSLTFRADWI